MNIDLSELGIQDMLYGRDFVISVKIYKIPDNKSLVIAITLLGKEICRECFSAQEVRAEFESKLNISSELIPSFDKLVLAIDYYFKTVNV